jgi:DNA-binding XRE family transcriptional regulator
MRLVRREECIICKDLLFAKLPALMGPEASAQRTRKKNTRKMNIVKKKFGGRPRRSDSEVDLRDVGGRIRQLRAGTTQEEFASVLGISQAQLSKYELGQSAPPLGVLIKLAEKYGKSTDWILTGRS